MVGVQGQSQGSICKVFSMASAKKSPNSVWEPSDKKSQRMPALRTAPTSSNIANNLQLQYQIIIWCFYLISNFYIMRNKFLVYALLFICYLGWHCHIDSSTTSNDTRRWFIEDTPPFSVSRNKPQHSICFDQLPVCYATSFIHRGSWYRAGRKGLLTITNSWNKT